MTPREIGSWAPRCEEVIISYDLRGKGIEGDPIRRVLQVHTKDGEFLAEDDTLPQTK